MSRIPGIRKGSTEWALGSNVYSNRKKKPKHADWDGGMGRLLASQRMQRLSLRAWQLNRHPRLLGHGVILSLRVGVGVCGTGRTSGQPNASIRSPSRLLLGTTLALTIYRSQLLG